MQTHIDLFFGDGEYSFALKIPQIVAIEAKCGPIGEVWARVSRGQYHEGTETLFIHEEAAFKYDDLVEVIRQGLIGGGAGTVDGQPVTVMSREANTLLQAYVLSAPLVEAWKLARVILGTLIEGYEPVDEAQKKSSMSEAGQESPSASIGEKSSPTAP